VVLPALSALNVCSSLPVVESTSTPVRPYPVLKENNERTIRRQLPHDVTHNQDISQTMMAPENILLSPSALELRGGEQGRGLCTLPSPRRSLEGLEGDVQKSSWSRRASVRGAEFRVGSEERESLLGGGACLIGRGACDLMLTRRPGLEGHKNLDDVRMSLVTLQRSMQHHVDERKKLLPVSHRASFAKDTSSLAKQSSRKLDASFDFPMGTRSGSICSTSEP
jgi:hypothetical protein